GQGEASSGASRSRPTVEGGDSPASSNACRVAARPVPRHGNRRCGPVQGILLARGATGDPQRWPGRPGPAAVGFQREGVDLLPSEESLEVFIRLRHAPRLDLDTRDSWQVRALSEELHSKKEQHLLRQREREETDWPVYKGESFDLWNPDTGVYYGWADPEPT